MLKYKSIFPPLQAEILRLSFKKNRMMIALFLLATLFNSACTVGSPLVFAYTVEVIRLGQKPDFLLFGLVLVYASLLAFTRLLTDVRMTLMHTIEQKVRLEANKLSLSALLRSAGSMFVANNPARIAELINSLHQSNAIYVQSFLIVVIGGTLDMLIAFGAIAMVVNWTVAAFVIIYGSATVWLTLRANKLTTQIQRDARKVSAEGTNLLGNAINNIVSIKIFQAQSWIQNIYENLMLRSKESWVRYFKLRLRFGALQAILIFIQYTSIIGIIIITFGSSGLLAQLVLVGMILMQLNRPFEMIANAIEEYAMAQVLAEMLQTELDENRGEAFPEQGEKIEASPVLELILQDVSFGYGEEQLPLFEKLSTTFKTGRLNFIVGPSGIGKSSLLQVLLRINEIYSGLVLVSDKDLRTIDTDIYLSAVGYVAQIPMLMNLSLRDNVLFGRHYSDSEVRETLRMVSLDDKLSRLPEGLDYRIGEGGQLLSGGERQRLVIARALIGKPKILILDEASSALDAVTEQNIYTSLRKVADEAIIIAVTHRLSVIKDGDSILDMSKFTSRKAKSDPN